MSTFLFTSNPFFTHLDWGGYLKTAVTLKQRGHKVLWATEKGSVADIIRQRGLEVVEVKNAGWHWDLPPEPHDYSPESWAAYRLQRNFISWLTVDKVATATQSLIELTQQTKVHAIISDRHSAAAALASEASNLPYAVIGTPAYPPTKKNRFPTETAALQEGQAQLQQLYQQFQITGQHFVELADGFWPQSPHLHISYFNQSWYNWHQQDILPQNKFVGGLKTIPSTPPPPWIDQLPTQLPIIFITLGPMFNQEPDFFKAAIKAVSAFGSFPVIGTFDTELAQALSSMVAPGMALILDKVDYNHLLPRLQLIIHPGDAGTTHAAILHALPQLIIVSNVEQSTEFQSMSQAKLGEFLHLEEVTMHNLQNTILSILSNNQLKTNCQHYQNTLAALPGLEGAADLLEAFNI